MIPAALGKAAVSDNEYDPENEPELIIAFPAKEAEREGWDEVFQDLELFDLIDEPEHELWPKDKPSLSLYELDKSTLAQAQNYRDVPRKGIDISSPSLRLQTFATSGDQFRENTRYQISGKKLRLTLFWRVLEEMERDWTLFVHLLGPHEKNWGQLDRQPAHGSHPTSQWKPGDLIIDQYEIDVSEEAKDELLLRIGWYDHASGERMLWDGGENQVDVLKLKVYPENYEGGRDR